MPKAPVEHSWFKFFHIRWKQSEMVRAMPMAARGCYLELLIEQYMNKGADLPEDPAMLKRMIGADSKEWAAFLPYLDVCFPAENGRRINETMAGLREQKDARDEFLKDISSDGVEARRGNRSGNRNGNHNGNRDGIPEKRREEKNKLGSNYNNARAGSTPGDSSPEKGKANAKKYVSTTGTGVFWPDGREKTLEEIRMAHR